MGPRADFVCLSRKCQVEGQASVYELPITATRCPCCGSKRLKRLYNAVNVSSGFAKNADAIIEPAYTQAMAPVEAAKSSPLAKCPPIAVPLRNLGTALGQIHPAFAGATLPSGKASADPRAPAWDAPNLRRLPPGPDPSSSRRDRDYTIKVKRDAAGNFVDAEAAKA